MTILSVEHIIRIWNFTSASNRVWNPLLYSRTKPFHYRVITIQCSANTQPWDTGCVCGTRENLVTREIDFLTRYSLVLSRCSTCCGSQRVIFFLLHIHTMVARVFQMETWKPSRDDKHLRQGVFQAWQLWKAWSHTREPLR